MFNNRFAGFAPAVVVLFALVAPAVAEEPTAEPHPKTTWLALAAADQPAVPTPTAGAAAAPKADADCVDWWMQPIDFGGGFGFSTKDSLHWRSANQKFKLRVGGRLQYDSASTTATTPTTRPTCW